MPGAESTERIIDGRAASPGVVLGPLVLNFHGHGVAPAQGDADFERGRLKLAIDKALVQLADIMAEAGGFGTDILAFQISWLEDPQLASAVDTLIEEGKSAHDAWSSVLNKQIHELRASDESVAVARAMDLVDLRERVMAAIDGENPDAERAVEGGSIYLGEDLTPSRFLALDWSRYSGAALLSGSIAGHVAILARARGVPMVIGLKAASESFQNGQRAVLDAEQGRLIVEPCEATCVAFEQKREEALSRELSQEAYRNKPAATANGEAVTVLVNLDDLSLLDGIDVSGCDGVGLVRSEMLMGYPEALHDEEGQLRDYQRIVDWADGRPVTIRTLDVGGDKPISGYTVEGEIDSFLGQRGLRLSLEHEAVFRVQLRALARAAVAGPMKVMLPMVTIPAEFERAREIMENEVDALRREGIDAAMPALGMMVEVPAAALRIGDFDADFFSVGSNDLTQYTMAVSRDNEAVFDLYDATNPAVLDLIGQVVEAANAKGKEVSLCGDIASDPQGLICLLELGLRSLSVAPSALGRVKQAIAGFDDGTSQTASTILR